MNLMTYESCQEILKLNVFWYLHFSSLCYARKYRSVCVFFFFFPLNLKPVFCHSHLKALMCSAAETFSGNLLRGQLVKRGVITQQFSFSARKNGVKWFSGKIWMKDYRCGLPWSCHSYRSGANSRTVCALYSFSAPSIHL